MCVIAGAVSTGDAGEIEVVWAVGLTREVRCLLGGDDEIAPSLIYIAVIPTSEMPIDLPLW